MPSVPSFITEIDQQWSAFHFSVAVPFARSINLTTKTNWEGTGVTPDVQVKSAEALQEARRLAVDKIRAKSMPK